VIGFQKFRFEVTGPKSSPAEESSGTPPRPTGPYWLLVVGSFGCGSIRNCPGDPIWFFAVIARHGERNFAR